MNVLLGDSMKLEVIDINENNNGTATLILDLDEETKLYLLNYAILDIVKKGLEEVEGLYKEGEDNGR